MLIFEVLLRVTTFNYSAITTKRTTEFEKIEKSFKIVKKENILNFKTIRYYPTALVKIIHSILNYKFMRPVSILRLPKE